MNKKSNIEGRNNASDSWLSLTLESVREQSSDQIYTCLTWMRPSGRIHIWHYVWALKNWLEIQEIEGIQSYFMIADKQVLWDHLQNPERRTQAVRDMVIDWVSLWLNHERHPFVLQSQFPWLSEITDYLMMYTPDSWIRNNPTVKEEMKKISNKEGVSSGFVNYPISQVADILGFSWNLVPVWEDQLPHIELARKIIRRVNILAWTEFPTPFALLSDCPRLIGTDGNDKMGKSLWNVIGMTATLKEIKKMVNSMYTDPWKTSISSPWNIDNHIVFKYLDIFYTDVEHLAELKRRYIEWWDNSVWDWELKKLLVSVLEEIIAPVRERREEVLRDESLVARVIQEWIERWEDEVGKNIRILKEALSLKY